MKCMSIGFAILGVITGMVAAWIWYQSSLIQYHPNWGLPGTGNPIEPVDEEQKQADINYALQNGLNEASRLNKNAALWTAISVFLNCLVALLSIF